MAEVWANEFKEILPTLRERPELRQQVLDLLPQPTAGKALEGGDRLQQFRGILSELVNGELTLTESYQEVSRRLPQESSEYKSNRQVFASGWEERLVRTQLSRFYNQAVLEHIVASGGTRCFVPHSSEEDRTTACSIHLAGGEHDATALHSRLVQGYRDGRFAKELKIPNHPHCTHVVMPLQK